MDFNRLKREDLSELKPYHVEAFPHTAKLDANESPFDLPLEIRQELAEALHRIPFHRYPDGNSDDLRAQLSQRLGVDKAEIVVGNGSDELILDFTLAFGRLDACVSFPTPTFSMYQILAQIARLTSVGLPLNDAFDLDAAAWQSHLDKHPVNLIFISYPNNPTGNSFSDDVIHRMLSQRNTLVVLDEAYYEFSGKTFLSERQRYPNLIVTRTFSKAYGLAGLRTGYMVAHPEIIEDVNKVRLPYNLNRFSQLAATTLLKHHQHYATHIQHIQHERARVWEALKRLEDVEPFPTDANFILFRTKKPATQVFHGLLKHGVLVRCLDKPGALQNCLRVTIGTADENARFLQAVEQESKRFEP